MKSLLFLLLSLLFLSLPAEPAEPLGGSKSVCSSESVSSSKSVCSSQNTMATCSRSEPVLSSGSGPATAALSAPSSETLIKTAITSQHCLRFTYRGSTRTVQPHRLGIAKTGNTLLRAFELSKDATPTHQWKLYNLEHILSPSILPDTFTPQPTYTPTDKALPTVLHEVPYQAGK